MTEDAENTAVETSFFGLPPLSDPKYRAAFDGDITAEEAAEFLRRLDFILRALVDLNFGVDAVQLALPALAEFNKQSESLTDFSGSGDSSHEKNNVTDFNSAVQKDAPQKE